MSTTVGSEVQDLEFALQADLGRLARLDGCQLRIDALSFGIRSVVSYLVNRFMSGEIVWRRGRWRALSLASER